MATPPLAPTAAEAKAYAAEQRTAIVRFLVIAFNVTAYWGWLYPAGVGDPVWAAVISVVAGVYGIYDLVARPYRYFPTMATAAWTALTDGVLILVWVHVSGGYDSPYYLLWYLSLVAVTFRYDWRATALAAVLYGASYVGLLAATGQLLAHVPDVTIRVAYILLVGALGALLARESTRVFEERFHLAQAVGEGDRFRALAEASPQALVIHRGETILDVNQAFCDLLALPREQALGAAPLQLLDDAGRAAARQQLDHPSDEPFDVVAHLKSGRRTLRIQSRAIDYRGEQARVAAVADVTDERLAADARAKALKNEMEVARLREMDRFKSEFINAAAHELNTPLTPLKLQLHVLKKRLAATSGPEKGTVEVLERNINRLSTLVEEMLDVARLESGRLRMEPKLCDIGKIVHETADTFREMARQRTVHVGVACSRGMMAVADDKRVTQILFNLVSNALKFTPAGGTVSLEGQVEDGAVRVHVRDTGIGLSAEQVDRLFHPFVQLHRDQVTAAGTGLGLYISRGIAERHGGTLTCASEGIGKGAVFTLRLPVGPVAAPAGAS